MADIDSIKYTDTMDMNKEEKAKQVLLQVGSSR